MGTWLDDFWTFSRTIYGWARSSGRVATRQTDQQPARSGPTEQGPNEGLPFGAGGIGVAHWEIHPWLMDHLLRGQRAVGGGSSREIA